MQSGILKRIQEKEKERDTYERQISDVNLANMDEKEKNLVLVSLLDCLSI